MTPSSQPLGSAPSQPTILVLSTDAVAAALLGALIESLELQPLFPQPGESARDALRRVRPSVALGDCELDEVCSTAFIGPARMLGTRVVLYGGPGSAAKLRAVGAAHSLPTILLPDEAARIADELLAAATRR